MKTAQFIKQRKWSMNIFSENYDKTCLVRNNLINSQLFSSIEKMILDLRKVIHNIETFQLNIAHMSLVHSTRIKSLLCSENSQHQNDMTYHNKYTDIYMKTQKRNITWQYTTNLDADNQEHCTWRKSNEEIESYMFIKKS